MAAECGLAATIVTPFLEVGKIVFGPIYRNTKSFFNLQSNLSSLQHKNTVLREIKDSVEQEIEEAGKLPTPQVNEWLRQVREILVVADQMRPGTLQVSGCLLRCGVCRKVRKTLEEVETLTEACPPTSARFTAINRPPPSVEHIPAPSIQDQTTAVKNLNRVMDTLSGDEVRSVGIWGMGGVGKTTLAKNLNNKLKSGGSSGQHFGMVIWATVSKDLNTRAVQAQIADRLKMEVGISDDEDRNAVRLHERLMKESKFLLILDDLWEAIDMNKLGIPKPEAHKGVKILLTSRFKRVFESMKTDEQVQVSVLNPDEAWEMFVEAAGNVANLEGIKTIAREVCQQCCGLPLAISIVGAAMRGKDVIPLWKDALSELEKCAPSIENVEEKVFKPLKWSYDKLQGNEKSCFLYCCLYPEDFSIKISELVKCWMGEGLIDEELNHEKSRNRGLFLIQKLKEACLLEKGQFSLQEGETVKMHDVVRDVAIWISSNSLEDGCKFLVRAGMGLSQLSKVKFSNNVKRISFMNNHIDSLSWDDACLIECSSVSTLLLQGNPSLVEIPDEFLGRFKATKVLDLSRTNIRSLPSSIMQLTDMRTLLLSGCKQLKELPTSGWEGLGRLEILDLAYTAIRELPSEMAKLIKLRELDLFGTKSLKSIPAGVFPMLSSLEILNMDRCLNFWRLKGEVEDGEAYLEELESLDTFSELFIHVNSKSMLSWKINPTWIGKLRSFVLGIGLKTDFYSHATNEICKELVMSIFDHTEEEEEEERIEYLLHITNATSLKIRKCGGMEKWVQRMGINTRSCFSALKFLSISDVTMRLGDTIGGEYGAKYDLLPNLEHLNLYGIKGMRSISELAGYLGLTFSKLQHLIVILCNEMKYLFSVGPDLILESLTDIDINSCEELEEVFEYVVHPLGHPVGIVPNLKKVYLRGNMKLKTLCKNNEAETWPSLETISVRGCDKLRKLPISGQNNNIKKIEGEESWWSNLEWDDPNTKTSLQPLFKLKY